MATIVAVFGLLVQSDHGFQFAKVQLRSDQSFQIAMVTIEDRSVLVEEPRYRTRGRRQESTGPNAPSTQAPTQSHFMDLEVPTASLRRAINVVSLDKQSNEHSELMTSLRAQNESFDSQALILIDSAIAGRISENVPEHKSTEIRVYDLDDPSAVTIRTKLRALPDNAHAILLTLRR